MTSSRIGDDTTPVAADTDDVVDASLSEPAAAGSGVPRRRGRAGQPHQRTVGNLAAEAAKHAAEFGRSEVDTGASAAGTGRQRRG